MRQLTADTVIRIKKPRPELTGDTKIRLSRLVGFKDWCGYLRDAKEWDSDEHPRGQPDNAGQFTKVFCGNLKENISDLQKTFDKANLPSSEKTAIWKYSKGLSDKINAYKRNPSAEYNPELEEQIELIDRALSRTTIGKNVKTYRTVNASKEQLGEYLDIKGIEDIDDEHMQEFLDNYLKTTTPQPHDEAFLSTTIDKNYDHKRKRKNKYHLKYQINAPKEAHGLYIASISEYPTQHELLIFRENDLDIKRIKFNISSKTFFINADLIVEGGEEK